MTASLNTTKNFLAGSRSNPAPFQHDQPNLKAVHSTQTHPPLHLVSPEGRLQIHTAPYRGSFSIVLSEALRAAGLGSRVMVVQFLKGGVNQGPAGSIHLCGQLEWLRPAITHCITQPTPYKSSDNSKSNTQKAVEEIWNICHNHLSKGDLDQLVLDEIGLAIALGYLNEEQIIATLEQKKEAMDVIITGPSIPARLMAIADQVTELRSSFQC